MLNRKEWYRTVYLRSDVWKAIRLDVALKFSGKCYICEAEDIGNDVHHIWYDDMRFVQPEQFTFLCRRCHIRIHELISPKQCCHLEDQLDALRKFKFFAGQIKGEIMAGKPKPKKGYVKPAPGIPHCQCCFGHTNRLGPFNPWRPDEESPTMKNPLLICGECKLIMKSELSARKFESGSMAWKWVKTFFISRRIQISPIDNPDIEHNISSGSPSYLGYGI